MHFLGALIKRTQTIGAGTESQGAPSDGYSMSNFTRKNSCSSIRSIAKKRWQHNPLFGYQIEKVRATQRNTIVYRIKADVYNKYLKPGAFKHWTEHEMLQAFPP